MRPIRTFFAIKLDMKTQTIFAKVIDVLKQVEQGKVVRWLAPENLHVTLKFLGDIHPTQSLALSYQVSKALRGIPPFKITFDSIGLFPTKQNPHVVAVEVHYSTMLQNLYAAVEKGGVTAGFPAESRPTRPHMTIGRIRGRQVPILEYDIHASKTSMLVDHIILYQSQMDRKGVKYIPLETLKLTS